MKNWTQPADVVTLIAPYAVSSGDGAKVGQIFGLATADYGSGAEGEFAVTGAADITKATGALSQGALIYWDDTAKNVTATASSNLLIGAVLKDAGSADPTANVRLNGTAQADEAA